MVKSCQKRSNVVKQWSNDGQTMVKRWGVKSEREERRMKRGQALSRFVKKNKELRNVGRIY